MYGAGYTGVVKGYVITAHIIPTILGNPQGAVVDSEMRKEYHGGYTENPCTVEMPHVYSTLRRNRISGGIKKAVWG